jgi:hypothetical protein
MMRARHSDRRSAAATVELAALLPFLMFLCVIGTDWARLFYYTITVEACARNGAIYASDSDYASKSPYTSVQQASLAEASKLLDTTGLTATTTTSGSTTTTTYTNGSGTTVVSVSTTTSITDSAGNKAVMCTVSVPFKTITNFPGVPNSQTLTRSVQMRTAELLTQ